MLNNLIINFFYKFILNNFKRLKHRFIKEIFFFNKVNYLVYRILKQ